MHVVTSDTYIISIRKNVNFCAFMITNQVSYPIGVCESEKITCKPKSSYLKLNYVNGYPKYTPTALCENTFIYA